jgi:hypothetical protein
VAGYHDVVADGGDWPQEALMYQSAMADDGQASGGIQRKPAPQL